MGAGMSSTLVLKYFIVDYHQFENRCLLVDVVNHAFPLYADSTSAISRLSKTADGASEMMLREIYAEQDATHMTVRQLVQAALAHDYQIDPLLILDYASVIGVFPESRRRRSVIRRSQKEE